LKERHSKTYNKLIFLGSSHVAIIAIRNSNLKQTGRILCTIADIEGGT